MIFTENGKVGHWVGKLEFHFSKLDFWKFDWFVVVILIVVWMVVVGGGRLCDGWLCLVGVWLLNFGQEGHLI